MCTMQVIDVTLVNELSEETDGADSDAFTIPSKLDQPRYFIATPSPLAVNTPSISPASKSDLSHLPSVSSEGRVCLS